MYEIVPNAMQRVRKQRNAARYTRGDLYPFASSKRERETRLREGETPSARKDSLQYMHARTPGSYGTKRDRMKREMRRDETRRETRRMRTDVHARVSVRPRAAACVSRAFRPAAYREREEKKEEEGTESRT